MPFLKMVYENESEDYALLNKTIDKLKNEINGITILGKSNYFIFKIAVLDFTIDKCNGWIFRLWPKYDKETKTNIVDYLILGEHFEFLDKFKPNNVYIQIDATDINNFRNIIDSIHQYPRKNFVASMNMITDFPDIINDIPRNDYIDKEYFSYWQEKRRQQQVYQKYQYNMLNNLTKDLFKIKGVTCVGYFDSGKCTSPRYDLEVSTYYHSKNKIKEIGNKINKAIDNYNNNHDDFSISDIVGNLRLNPLRIIYFLKKDIINECKYSYINYYNNTKKNNHIRYKQLIKVRKNI